MAAASKRLLEGMKVRAAFRGHKSGEAHSGEIARRFTCYMNCHLKVGLVYIQSSPQILQYGR